MFAVLVYSRIINGGGKFPLVPFLIAFYSHFPYASSLS